MCTHNLDCRERGGYNTVETTFIPQDAGIKEIPDKVKEIGVVQ